MPEPTFLERRFIASHGIGEENQALVYRCLGCRHLVTWKKIRLGGCGCGSNRIIPTRPYLLEWVKLFLFPWSV